MLVVFFPLLLGLLFPNFSFQYQRIRELNFLELERKGKQPCPKSLREYLESPLKASCLPPFSDHAHGRKNGAQELVDLFLEIGKGAFGGK